MGMLAVWVVVACLLGAPAAAGNGEKPFKPSRAEVAASFKPTLVGGVPWYAGVGAARAYEARQPRAAGAERLILHLRILGTLDGRT